MHLFFVYDPILGTCTIYVNGEISGTPETGLAATLKPDTTATTAAFGVEKQTGAAVTANSQFVGAMDGFTLFRFSGIEIAAGTPTPAPCTRATAPPPRPRWP